MPGLLDLVDAPPVPPAPYGLLETIGPTTGEGHWTQGVLYTSVCPDGGTTYDECLAPGPPAAPPTKADNITPIFRGASPFTVYAAYECAAVGIPDLETLADRALARVEGWQVERAFWTGNAGGQAGVVLPHLAEDAPVAVPGATPGQGVILQTAATVVSGGGADPAQALGALEAALADCYKGAGVLHVPVAALATLAAKNLVERRGQQLTTAAGTLVVVGGGYPGTSPAGVAPAAGTSWIYGTGRPFIYRGPSRSFPIKESLNRAENTVLMLAERTYLVAWECCHLAAALTLGSN